MLVTNLGRHDLIIGRKWLAKQDVWLDIKNRKLLQPGEKDERAWVVTQYELTITKKALAGAPINPDHQKDANRRDRAIAAEKKKAPVRILQRPPGKAAAGKKINKPRQGTLSWGTHQKDLQSNINKINKKLTGGDPLPQPRPVKKTRFPDNLPKINIVIIRKIGFYRNALKKESTVFVTSLYEINRILEEKANKRELTQEKHDTEVNKLLPKRYYDIKDVFSKAASNELLPYRDNDHKIELEAENSLSYSPLYK